MLVKISDVRGSMVVNIDTIPPLEVEDPHPHLAKDTFLESAGREMPDGNGEGEDLPFGHLAQYLLHPLPMVELVLG
jgi:hypothetical protein